ncbi:unnamed protein product [Paramecium pentaurelia]|uniref:Uncharacterized protein n=1 Tax=Paramecium pentaurelia TaxID=43138 RepID=A0A8S1UHD2_9CILI|nr:unnamed protein product [Paramecium pentaurelia]
MDQNDKQIDEEQFKKEFEERVEKRKQWLLEELKSCGKFLDVSAKKLDDLDALTIALYLHECQAELTVFHIGANSITDRGFIDMLTGLQWHDKLKEIYIGNNEITEIGIQGLIEISSCFKQLKILSMSSCSIDDSTFIQLCYALPELKNLQQLQVPANNISDYGLICFSTLLATNSLPNLTVVHFGNNPLTSKSLVPFFQAMKKNKTIKILYLNDIGMELATIKQLAVCLKKNKTLEDLNLGNTGFSDSAAIILWPSLKYLKKLQLWNNHLTNKAIYEFINVLEREDIGLTYVGLQDNEIEEFDLVEDLNALLKQNEIIDKLTEQIEHKEEPEEVDEDKQVKQMIELAKLEEIEEKLGELEKLNEPQEEIQDVVNELQGKLKTKKWAGEIEDPEDKTLKHSVME